MMFIRVPGTKEMTKTQLQTTLEGVREVTDEEVKKEEIRGIREMKTPTMTTKAPYIWENEYFLPKNIRLKTRVKGM